MCHFKDRSQQLIVSIIMDDAISTKRTCQGRMRPQSQSALVGIIIFGILVGAGVTFRHFFVRLESKELSHAANEFAVEKGRWFADNLDSAVLPLYHLSLFAVEIDDFKGLPQQIGAHGSPGSRPLRNDTAFVSRDVRGVCDDQNLVNRFEGIVSRIESRTGLGTMHRISLAPQGVLCLRHVSNAALGEACSRSTNVLGIDALYDPKFANITRRVLQSGTLSVAGPTTLLSCPTCGTYFIARYPIEYEEHQIIISGESLPRWGFAVGLVSWDDILRRFKSRVSDSGVFDFQLKTKDGVVLRQSKRFRTHSSQVVHTFDTVNGEWQIIVQYESTHVFGIIILLIVIVGAIMIVTLVLVVLGQRQRQMEYQALAATRQVEIEQRMTAYIAHELRNPLSSVISALSLFPTNLGKEVGALHDGMKLCCSFMQTILNNLLDSRQLAEGKMDLKSQPVSISEVLRKVQVMFTPHVHTGVQLLVETANTDDCDYCLGDSHRIQQILNNVVSNATKYTHHGSIELVGGWNKGKLRLECRDTGPGIPQEEIQRIFERFVTRGGAPGSGLGLLISKQLSELMGGEIWFESDPTVKPGTTCVIELALVQCNPPTGKNNQEPDVPEEEDTPIQDSLQILVVDDLKLNRRWLRRRLEKKISPNSLVEEACCGEEALKLCGSNDYDIIIMDHYMDEGGGILTGVDTIIALRRQNVKACIVGCSGNDLETSFLLAGADLVWRKPLPSDSSIIRQLRPFLPRETTSTENKESELCSETSAFDDIEMAVVAVPAHGKPNE